MSKKIVAVVGATGAQGGGLAHSLLSDPAFAVRAITRKPDGEKGQALRAAGAEVVAAELDDVASLRRAFEGAHAAFCVTNFWEHFSPEKELQQARNLAQAAKDARVGHVLWSTLEDTRKHIALDDPRMPTLKEKYKVPHFDSKGEADQFFVQSGVPYTLVLTSFYWENLIYFGMNPKPGPDGQLAFVLPMGNAKLPGIAVEDIGKCVHGILRRGAELQGKTVGVAGEHLTGAEMAAAMSRAFDKPVAHVSVPFEVYRNFGFPGADDLGNMFQFKHDFPDAFMGARDLSFCRALNPELQTFSTWLSRNKAKIPLT